MTNVLKWILIILFLFIGVSGFAVSFTNSASTFLWFLGLLMSFLITIPAVKFWDDYLKTKFK